MIFTSDQATKSQNYQAYLIRLWRSSPDVLWSASAQHTQSGETVFFASLESLFHFLHDQTVASDVSDLRRDD
ncbi:MAG TPA: hypothetical protein PKM78_02710 [Anaerolineae bacterium]|nr:hypothetical protein [Anaerolineae bacterium]HNU03417.1 hypothetical protein [Anaerolineae bacterium]